MLLLIFLFSLQKRRNRKRKSSEGEADEVAASPESLHSNTTEKSQPQRRSTTPMAEVKATTTPNGYRPAAAPKLPEKKFSKKPKLNGFDRGEGVSRVLGASDVTGELMFLVKFDENDSAEMIPSIICNLKCPQKVIQFYEERLVWHSDKETDEEDENQDGTDVEKTDANGTAEEDNNSVEQDNDSADDA